MIIYHIWFKISCLNIDNFSLLARRLDTFAMNVIYISDINLENKAPNFLLQSKDENNLSIEMKFKDT